MEEGNPLEIHTSVSVSTKLHKSNKRGRPSLAKALKFSPQPKSIISRLLHKVKKGNRLTVKDEINLSKEEKTNLEDDSYSGMKSDLEPDAYDDFRESFTLDLPEGDDHNKYRECCLLHKKEPNINQSIHCDKKVENMDKIFEVACYVCPHRSCSQKEHREHVSIHKNQPYKCNFPNCSYVCKLSCNLIKHKRIHTLEKPYLCDQCTFRTNFGNSLKVHKRIHTSEKPYGCKYCSYQCNSSSNLKKHCLHRHKEMS